MLDVNHSISNQKSIQQESKLKIMPKDKEMNEKDKQYKTSCVLQEKCYFDSNIKVEKLTYINRSGNQVLKDFYATFKTGKKYALVGANIEENSMLVKILMKYYRVYQGIIEIDNMNLNKLPFENLYNNISILEDKIFIFKGSIRDNITLLKDYNITKINKAVNSCGIVPILEKNRLNIDDNISEYSEKISLEEKLRIFIARCLLKGSKVFIVDESILELTFKEISSIEETLINIDNLTLITVTDRIIEDNLKLYDSIIVTKNGTVLEEGNWIQLINLKGYFFKLYKEQLKEANQ